ncbi:MAG: 23S rRNA (guanosine(2251)-2'-O)-methyltransferase RlmB [Treponemataceae bacterium]
MHTITGFHAIEEKIKSLQKGNEKNAKIFFDKPGPRVKKIMETAKSKGIDCSQVSSKELDKLVSALNESAREHRGIVLQLKEENQIAPNMLDFSQLKGFLSQKKGKSLIVVLDSITSPHNVGAILRSCDQFGVDLAVLPNRKSATDSEIIERSSSGASSWVSTMIVPNLSRILEILKEQGYWIYGADANGEDIDNFIPAEKIALVMGSEGKGMKNIIKEQCDKILSIKTCGKLDSLNVSVAAGILLYKLTR